MMTFLNLTASIFALIFSFLLLLNTIKNSPWNNSGPVAKILILNFCLLFGYSLTSAFMYTHSMLGASSMSHDISAYRSLASNSIIALVTYTFLKLEKRA